MKTRSKFPQKAFILAAGFGKRLQPHTLTRPKPLVEVAGISLLDRTLDHLKAAGIRDIVINAHYLADQIAACARERTDMNIMVSHEETLLDTGGGIANTLDFFENQPFFVLSGDGLWTEGPDKPLLQALAEQWDGNLMDILIALQPVRTMTLTRGIGDYDLTEDGQAVRSLNQTGSHMFTSIRIHHPRIFKERRNGIFSYLECLDQAQADGRLYGLVHGGDWHHISTPADLERVDAALRAGAA